MPPHPCHTPAASGRTPDPPGLAQVCFLTCLRFNFWEDCVRAPSMPVVADKAATYIAADVKVLHFIAYRKLGIQVQPCCLPPWSLRSDVRHW